MNFEGPPPAREYFVANAGYWIDEFHFDGLRLDATQDIHDASPEHVIASIVRRARGGRSPLGRRSSSQRTSRSSTRLVRPTCVRADMALTRCGTTTTTTPAVVALTGVREAYYTDYTGGRRS